jgi:hypothetical protein
MKAKLIAYSVKNLSISDQNQVRKAINGHNDVSHGSQYKYRRKGLLDRITHIRPSRGTVILPKKEALEFIEILKKYKTETKIYDIDIAKKEFLK